MNRIKLSNLAIAMSMVATLAACGGGGGSDSAAAPAPAPAPAPVGAPTAGDLATTVQPATYPAGSHESSAYQAVNAARMAGGFGTLAQATAIDQEAADQAAYVAENYAVADSSGGLDWDVAALMAKQPDGNETAHVQLSTMPGYIGYAATDRATHFGYPSIGAVAEDASFTVASIGMDLGADCVAALLASPGHRQALLDPRWRDIGVGFADLAKPFDSPATMQASACYVATAVRSQTWGSTGYATAPAGWVGLWPIDGSTGLDIVDSHGHGYAPSVTVDSSKILTTTSFTIADSSGSVVPTTLNADLQQGVWGNWAFATPNATALATGTTYTVHFVGSAAPADGSAAAVAIDRVWTFTTVSH